MTPKLPLIRLFLSALLLFSLPAFDYVYTTFEGPVEGQAAVAQLEDDDVTYGVARRVVVDDGVRTWYAFGVGGGLGLLWGTWVFSNRKQLFSYS